MSDAAARERKARVQAKLDRHPYGAPIWIRNPHLQTIWGPLVRPLGGRSRLQDFRLERVPTPDDDFLRLHFLGAEAERPTLLVLHGLEGSLRSHNVQGVALEARSRLDWNVVVMEHRSCGGELNRARRLYHSGETSDLAFVVQRLLERGVRELYAFGISLGGNVLAKWLGEHPREVPTELRAAAVLCPPFDLTVSGPTIDRALGGVYARRFLRTLVPKAVAKAHQFPGSLDLEKVRNSATFRDFDTYATAALHGFRDAEHYWEVVSCGQFLESIRTPTLLVAAADDPFNPSSTLPHDAVESSPYLFDAMTRRGGHTGFVTGSPLRTSCWGERQAVRFFQWVAQEPSLD